MKIDRRENKLVRLAWWRIAKWVVFAALVMYFVGSIFVMNTIDALLLIKVLHIPIFTLTLEPQHTLLTHPINTSY